MPWIAEWNARGPEGKQGKQGDRGLPGLENVPTDPGVAELIGAGRDSQTGAAVLAMAHRPELVNPRGLDRWRKRLGEAFFNPVGIICQGDSITDGAWANGTLVNDVAAQERWAAGGFVGQLRRLLAPHYGYAGEQLRNFTDHDIRWTVTGSATPVATGVASTARRFGPGVYAEVTVPDGTTSVRVPCMVWSNGGMARVLVDGADKTPTVLTGARDAMTGSWGGANASVAYGTEGGVNVVDGTVTVAGTIAVHSGIAADSPTVTPGQWLMHMAEVKCTTNNRTVLASLIFLDAAGTVIAGTEVMGPSVSGSVNTYRQVQVVGQVPSGAVRVAVAVRSTNATVGDVFRVRYSKAPYLTRVTNAGAGAQFVSYAAPVTSGSHVIRVVGGAGTTTDVVGLVENADPAAKIRVHGSALSSTTTRDHARPDLTGDARTNYVAGMYSAVESSPGLVVIALGANDYNKQASTGITPAEYKANLLMLISSVRDLGGCVLLVAGPRWSDDTLPVNQATYYAQARALALEQAHVAFFDLAEAWGDFASADAKGFQTDSPHPNLAGHGDLARIVWSVLTRPTEPA